MEQLEEKALNIYTDGACYASPRVGGVGYLFVSVDDRGYPQIHEECPPGWRSATNNQMELQACIEAQRVDQIHSEVMLVGQKRCRHV